MNKRNKMFKILIIVLMLFIMTGCENAKIETYCMRCGTDTYFPLGLVNFCAGAVNFIKIIVPTIIVIIGMIDLVRAIIASDEKQMEEAKKSLIRKFIAGIMIFLVIAIVQFIFSLIPDFNKSGSLDVFECMEHFINGYDFKDNCPPRANGKSVDIKDKEEGYTPEDYEEEIIVRDGTLSECKSLTTEELCLNEDDETNCSWSDTGYNISGNIYHCVTVGYRHSEYACYESNMPDSDGGRTRKWLNSSPGTMWHIATQYNSSTCVSDKKVCYECTEGIVTSYVWDLETKNPNSNICKKTTDSKCNSYEKCWKCSETDYRWQKNDPSSGSLHCVTAPDSDCDSVLNEKNEACYYCSDSSIRYIWSNEYVMGCIKVNYSKNQCLNSK